jgi:hypothetical protein
LQLIPANQPWGRAADDGWLRLQAPMVAGFLLTVYLLEIQQPEGITTLKIGNFILVIGAMFVVRATALRRARGELPPVHFSPHDYVYLCYILWLYASAFWTVAFAPTLVITTYLTVVWLATVSLNFYPTLGTIRIFAKFAALLAIVSILIWPIYPDTALQPASSTGLPELRGLIDHQLRFGMLMCLVLGLVGIAIVNGEADALRGRWPRWMLYAVVLQFFVAVVLSRALGCTAAFAVELMFSGLLSRNRTIMLASDGGLVAI